MSTTEDRTAQRPRWAAALLLAAALGLGAAGTASEAGTAAGAATHAGTTGAVFTAGEEPEDVTWGVQPSSAGGPDGRTTFDFAVAPGTLIEDWITVTNYSNQSAGFRVYASDATTDYDTAAFTLIGAEQASIDLGAWTQVDSGPAECPDTNDEAEEICAHDLGVRIALGPGESRTLPIAINVPFDATPGDHSAGVVASFEQEAAEDDGTTVLLEQRVGARVYLRVDGPLAASVGVSGVTASYDGVVNPVGKGAATVGFDITNTGNVRLSGVPDVRLTGPFGIDLGAVELEPVSNLLPGGTGHVTAKLPDVAPLFFLAAKVTVRPEPGDGAVGDVPLALDPVTGSAQTWAVPWSALGLIALLAGGSWFVVWRRRRSRQLLAAELAVYTEELLAGAGSGAGFAPAAAPAPGRRAFSAPARAWFPRRPRGSGWRPELGSLLGSKPVPRIPSGTAAIGAAR